MKKRLLIILPLLFSTVFAVCQINRQKSTDNASLEGKVTFMTIFVDTSEDLWDDDEKDHFFAEFERSQEWIADQAFGYGNDVEFDNNSFFYDNKEAIYVDAITMGENSPSEIIRKLVHKRGYLTFEEFLNKNRYEGPISKLKIILFVKSKGRSHAFKRRSIDNVDIAVIYCKSSYGMLTDKYVMAHEILHQFGAWDLYYGESQTTASAAKAKELYPSSIMINTHKNKSYLVVDRLTGWRVGWTDYEEEFVQFDPTKLRDDKKWEDKFSKKDGFSIKLELDPEKRKKKREARNQNN